MTPILIQLSPRRYIVVFTRISGITGGSFGHVEFKWADVAYGPATYAACMDWIKEEAGVPKDRPLIDIL